MLMISIIRHLCFVNNTDNGSNGNDYTYYHLPMNTRRWGNILQEPSFWTFVEDFASYTHKKNHDFFEKKLY